METNALYCLFLCEFCSRNCLNSDYAAKSGVGSSLLQLHSAGDRLHFLEQLSRSSRGRGGLEALQRHCSSRASDESVGTTVVVYPCALRRCDYNVWTRPHYRIRYDN